VGAPVDYRGLPIGEVTHIGVEGTASERNPNPLIAVDIRVYPSRLPTNGPDRIADNKIPDQRARLDPMVAHGFRAQLRNGNLLTGQLYVALDFFPEAPKARMDWQASPPTLPVVPGSLDSLQDSLMRLVKRLDELPVEMLVQDVHRTLGTLEQSLKNVDQLVRHIDSEVPGQAGSALQEARGALADVRRTLGTIDQTAGPQAQQALGEMAKAARSLRTLADYLERHPESLLKGKPEDPK
jgi:paraquat-inducible protein B